jgi:hypothetical protein
VSGKAIESLLPASVIVDHHNRGSAQICSAVVSIFQKHL